MKKRGTRERGIGKERKRGGEGRGGEGRKRGGEEGEGRRRAGREREDFFMASTAEVMHKTVNAVNSISSGPNKLCSPSSYEPGIRAGSVSGTKFAFCS